jgi:hypothetical protein
MGSVAILWTSSIGFTSETFSQVPSDQLFSVNVHRYLRNHLWIVKLYVSTNHVYFSCRNISSLPRLPCTLTEKAYSNDHMPVSSVLVFPVHACIKAFIRGTQSGFSSFCRATDKIHNELFDPAFALFVF